MRTKIVMQSFGILPTYALLLKKFDPYHLNKLLFLSDNIVASLKRNCSIFINKVARNTCKVASGCVAHKIPTSLLFYDHSLHFVPHRIKAYILTMEINLKPKFHKVKLMITSLCDNEFQIFNSIRV